MSASRISWPAAGGTEAPLLLRQMLPRNETLVKTLSCCVRTWVERGNDGVYVVDWTLCNRTNTEANRQTDRDRWDRQKRLRRHQKGDLQYTYVLQYTYIHTYKYIDAHTYIPICNVLLTYTCILTFIHTHNHLRTYTHLATYMYMYYELCMRRPTYIHTLCPDEK